jgi:hypothetical protein
MGSGSSKAFAQELKTQDIGFKLGNTSGNIINGGYAVQAGGWIYYSNNKDEDRLYKAKINGMDKVKLCQDKSSNLNILGNWIYYRNDSDGGKIYKIKIDGKQRTRINSEKSTNILVSKDYILYTQAIDSYKEDGGKIYKISLKTLKKTRVNNIISKHLNLVGNSIYYTQGNYGGSIYKIGIDGKKESKISEGTYSNIVASDGWIYFIENYKLSKMKLDGSAKTIIDKERCYGLNIQGNWIYYINGDDEYSIYRMLKDGNNQSKLADTKGASKINLAGDWLYYKTSDQYNRFYQMNTDGSGVKSYDIFDSWILGIKENQIVYNFHGNNLNKICCSSLDGNNDKELMQAKFSGYHAILDDNWLYYQNDTAQDMNKLYKIRQDGAEKTKLNDEESLDIRIIDDWIYFTNDSGTYKIKKDGTLRTKLTNDVAFEKNIVGNWLYYSCISDNSEKLYKIKTDGTERTKITDDVVSGIRVAGDWIYFIGGYGENYGKIYKVKTDGTNKVRLLDEYANSFWVENGWVYYLKGPSSGGYLAKVDTNGENNVQLGTDLVQNIDGIINNKIYYTAIFTKDSNLYGIKIDGTERIMINR